MQELIQTVVFGLATGGLIAVAAVGLALSFSVTGFINFAYGELLTISAYTAFLLTGAGWHLSAAAGAAVVATGVASVLLARLFYEPLRGRGAMPLLITSIGVSFLLQNLIQIGVGADPRRFPLPLLRPWTVGFVFLPKVQMGIFLIAALCMLLLHLLLKGTLIGLKMRATSDNDALARVSGVDTRRTVLAAWLMAGLFAGIGGVLLGATQITIQPTMGFVFLPALFAAVILGGIGHPYGAMVGGLIVGLGMELGATYVSSDYTVAFAFAALLLGLLLRPQGILGRTA